jgi:hypothetical protein
MSYLDFVDRVLTFIGVAVSGPDPNPPDLFDLSKHFGCADIHDQWSGPLHHALEFAVRDLLALGLVEPDAPSLQYIRLTADGKHMARSGLRTLWSPILEGSPLDDASLAILRAICTAVEKPHPEFCELEWTDSIAILASASLTFNQLHEIWQELEARGAVVGKVGTTLDGPVIAPIRATYIGFVLATQDANIRLQELVAQLVEDWEGATVDHKRELGVNNNTEKAELTKDILALANTKARGGHYLVVGFDDRTHEFAQSFDVSITKDRIEDILGTRASAVPGLRVDVVPWPGGEVGLIEVLRDPAKLPYKITRDLTNKIHKDDVFVRRGSHIAKADADELADLAEEARRAAP